MTENAAKYVIFLGKQFNIINPMDFIGQKKPFLSYGEGLFIDFNKILKAPKGFNKNMEVNWMNRNWCSRNNAFYQNYNGSDTLPLQPKQKGIPNSTHALSILPTIIRIEYSSWVLGV